MIRVPGLRLARDAIRRARLAAAAAEVTTFLVSYPKSGRTWLRFMLSTYLNGSAQLGLNIDLHSMFAVVPNFDFDPVRGFPAWREHSGGRVPLVAVSHLPYDRLLFRRRPVLFMLRDPRDVLASSFFHATRHKNRFQGEIDSFLMDPGQGLPHLTRYLNGWANGLPHHRHLVVTYERLTSDPATTLTEVLEFIGVRTDPEQVTRSVRAGAFSSMRSLEVTGGLPGHNYNRSDPDSLRVRRGKVRGFEDELAVDQVAWIEKMMGRSLDTAARGLLARAELADCLG